MSGLDDTLRPVAARLVTQYGKTITLTRQSSGDYDPTTGSSDVGTDEVSLKAVIEKYSALDRAAGDIEAGDVKVMISDLDPPPSVGDAITINDVQHVVMAVDPTYTGEGVGIYEMQARRA